MTATLHPLPRPHATLFLRVRPAARWRLRLRTWWLARRDQLPLTLLVDGLPQATTRRSAWRHWQAFAGNRTVTTAEAAPTASSAHPTPSAPASPADRHSALMHDLLRLNLQLERARLQAGADLPPHRPARA